MSRVDELMDLSFYFGKLDEHVETSWGICPSQ